MQIELCRFAGTMTMVYAKTLFLSVVAFAAMQFPLSALAAAPTEVWVSDSLGTNDIAIADGTREHPYKTIQFGISKVATGGTVKIMEGIYATGESYAGGCSNRVVISKKITLEGVDGKEVTHIVGKKADTSNGTGTAAVRPIVLDSSLAYGSIIKGLTLRGGATRTGTSGAASYGGGVMVASGGYTNRDGAYLVDCVVSNCAADVGGGIFGVTAVRCLIAGNKSLGWGAGAIYCNLLNCLLTGNQNTYSSGVRGAVTDSVSVNCTVVRNRGSKARGFDKRVSSNTPTSTPQKIYNCVSFENSNSDYAGSITVRTNSYSTADNAKLLYDAVNGDFRLSPGTVAVGGGLTEFLSLISLPEGISANKDYAGNDIDPENTGICDSGCLQGYVHESEKAVTITAASGGIALTGAVVGANTIAVGSTVTITPTAGTRPCVGVKVNGVEYLFNDSPSISIAITDTLPSSNTIVAIYTKDWYVDANAEDDSGTGFYPNDSMKTLTNAMVHAASGDTIHAAAGRYDEGSVVVSGSTRARVSVKSGVTLVADEGPENTFIIGGPADISIDPYGFGLGTNAIRCAYVAKNGHLKGFTLTGGRTHYLAESSYSQTYSGGGVVGPSADRDSVYVVNCIISNNFASFGGGARYANLIKCRVFENKATYDGGAVYECHAYGSIFNRNRQGTASDDSGCRNVTRFIGCTLGPDNRTINEKTANRTLTGTSSASGQIHGCLFLGSAAKGAYTLSTPISYCVFKGTAGFANTNCIFSAANLKVDDDLRPITGQNDAVDAWDYTSFTSKYAYASISTELDISGAPRVRNGRPDIGALESDPKPWYGKLLDGKGKYVTVTEADNMVTNIANGVTLQDGMAVSLTWASVADDALRTGHVCVTGEGTLTVLKDNEPYATYTEADGEVEFSFAATGKSAALVFSFEGEGSADVYSFSSPIGTMLILR